jgi:hypothetical protein
MRKLNVGVIAGTFLACCFTACAAPAADQSDQNRVELRKTDAGWTLFRNGQPFFIKGAGGDADKQTLVDRGGNSFRTWGADDIDNQLAQANRLGLAVTVGIWLEHSPGQHHFDYNNPDQVAKQLERVRQTILKYRDNPAVLVWGLGNEMEGYKQGDDPAIWHAVQDAAAMVHKLDPNHPTMTVIAEIGGQRVQSINRYCPDIDIIGINSYAGAPSVAQRYRAMGGTKPYIITEFGPQGQWEVGKNAWGAPLDSTSTDKAKEYRQSYEKSILGEKDKLCLGSYAFLWGFKREATATWYGMFLPDGSRTEAVDTMSELWTGHAPAHRCPQIEPLVVDREQVAPQEIVHAKLRVTDPDNYPMTVKWALERDPAAYNTGGEFQGEPEKYPDAIVRGDLDGADVRLPAGVGGYWLYAYVYDGHGGAAVADIPLAVTAASAPSQSAGPSQAGAASASGATTAKLPLILFSDGIKNPPYVWSGWMGDTAGLTLDANCPTNPHSGKSCMKCQYKGGNQFFGVAWQNPVNDWGNQPGGFNLSGATKLTFWARGQDGGELVTFKLGILGSDAKFHDSDHAELNDVTLTKDWQQYSIPLAGKDLSCIKTGFVWVMAATSHAVTFYLDDIQYE